MLVYITLGTTLSTVRADYDRVWWLFSIYQVLNRTIRSAALPYPKHGCRRMPAPMRSPCSLIFPLCRSFTASSSPPSCFSSCSLSDLLAGPPALSAFLVEGHESFHGSFHGMEAWKLPRNNLHGILPWKLPRKLLPRRLP